MPFYSSPRNSLDENMFHYTGLSQTVRNLCCVKSSLHVFVILWHNTMTCSFANFQENIRLCAHWKCFVTLPMNTKAYITARNEFVYWRHKQARGVAAYTQKRKCVQISANKWFCWCWFNVLCNSDSKWGFCVALCFGMHSFLSFLVLQSSWRGREKELVALLLLSFRYLVTVNVM